MKIKKIKALEIFESRGLPTLECILTLDNDISFKAKVPHGVSKSRYEAVELQDGDKRFSGLGLRKAIDTVESTIAPQLVGRLPDAIQMDLDLINSDATPNKSYLGANVTLAISMCVYRAQSFIENLELFEFISYVIGSETVSLPIPILNFINGGMHARNNLSIQEYLIIPGGAQSFSHSMEISHDFYQVLKKFLEKNNKKISIGDTGGISTDFDSSEEPLEYLTEAKHFLDLPSDTFLTGIDVAASHLFDPTTRLYQFNDDVKTSQQLIDWYQDLVRKYNLYYLEDPIQQDDAASWIKLTNALSDRALIAGDDIFATNVERIMQGLESFVANAAVIKPNQVGTITETIQAIKVAQEGGIATVVSHRAGETEDDFIADLSVGASANFIKSGGLVRSEHLAKYNRLLEIESYLLSME